MEQVVLVRKWSEIAAFLVPWNVIFRLWSFRGTQADKPARLCCKKGRQECLPIGAWLHFGPCAAAAAAVVLLYTKYRVVWEATACPCVRRVLSCCLVMFWLLVQSTESTPRTAVTGVTTQYFYYNSSSSSSRYLRASDLFSNLESRTSLVHGIRGTQQHGYILLLLLV